MKELLEYFTPVDISGFSDGGKYYPGQLGSLTTINHDDNFDISENTQIAIIGVGENREAIRNKGTSKAPDEVRSYLYELYTPFPGAVITDLGNLKVGHKLTDTYFALAKVIAQLIKRKIVPVIVGGSQDLTYANFLGYQELEQAINLVTIDASFDMDREEAVQINSGNFLTKILLHQPNYLFNYSNIGYQSYFVSDPELELLEKLYFDSYRLGEVRGAFKDAEPVIRNADFISFDLTAVRQSEAPGNGKATPNGFFGDEACQLSRYAGMSDKLSSIGFYELNPELDVNGQTSHLTAQMIWYFIEGFYNRKQDFPVGDKEEYLKYRVNLQDGEDEIVFYKSEKSDRWWMDVPYPSHEKIRFERHLMVPCTYEDYQMACKNEMPDRWWQTFQKLR